jgi:hypothetical protein
MGNRMNAWELKKYDMPVQDTRRTATAQLSKLQGEKTEEQRGKTFSRLVLQGKLRSAVRCLTSREMGGAMLSDNTDAKTGDTVREVLQSKHPKPRVPDPSVMEDCGALPAFVELDTTADAVERAARPTLQTCNIGSFDLEGPAQNFARQWRNLCGGRQMTIHHGPCDEPFEQDDLWHSTRCQEFVQQGSARPSNGSAPNVICSSVETRPKKLAEWTSCALASRQGLKAARTLQNFIGKNTPKKRNGDSCWLMHAMDSANEGNRMPMPWTTRHEWASGARFVFNCCHHFVMLLIRTGSDLLLIVLSKEGVTQGEPLAMVMRGVGLLPLISILKKPSPTCIRPGALMPQGLANASREFDFALRSFKNAVPRGDVFLNLQRAS